jgi:ketosteroid isomerase-like protein
MASEAFELTQRSWKYVDGRDLDGFLSIVDENIEFISVVAEAEGGTYSGHEGVRIWWEQVGESLGTLRYQPTEMHDLGNGGVLTELVVTAKVEGVEVPQTMWHAVQVRDSKAVWWGSFRTRDEALDGLEAFRSRS